jgi:hypothetical protein
MGKRGPRPQEKTLSARVNMRLDPDTYAAYEMFAEVTGTTPTNVMRQALDSMADTLVTMAEAFRQMKGGEPVKGLELYTMLLDSLSPQLQVQQRTGQAWLQQALDGSRHVVSDAGELGDQAAGQGAVAASPAEMPAEDDPPAGDRIDQLLSRHPWGQ